VSEYGEVLFKQVGIVMSTRRVESNRTRPGRAARRVTLECDARGEAALGEGLATGHGSRPWAIGHWRVTAALPREGPDHDSARQWRRHMDRQSWLERCHCCRSSVRWAAGGVRQAPLASGQWSVASGQGLAGESAREGAPASPRQGASAARVVPETRAWLLGARERARQGFAADEGGREREGRGAGRGRGREGGCENKSSRNGGRCE
jgi:hypothetical protein